MKNDNAIQFLKEMLKEAHGEMPTVMEDELVNDLYPKLQDRMILTALVSMGQEKQEEFKDLAENSDSKAIQEFLMRTLPDYEKIFAQAMEEFKEVYLDAV